VSYRIQLSITVGLLPHPDIYQGKEDTAHAKKGGGRTAPVYTLHIVQSCLSHLVLLDIQYTN